MRLLEESVLQIWKARKAAVRDEIAYAERAAKAIPDKLDRLDEAFLARRRDHVSRFLHEQANHIGNANPFAHAI